MARVGSKGRLLLLRCLRAGRHRPPLLDRCAQEQPEEAEEEEAEQLQEGGGGDGGSDKKINFHFSFTVSKQVNLCVAVLN